MSVLCLCCSGLRSSSYRRRAAWTHGWTHRPGFGPAWRRSTRRRTGPGGPVATVAISASRGKNSRLGRALVLSVPATALVSLGGPIFGFSWKFLGHSGFAGCMFGTLHLPAPFIFHSHMISHLVL